MTLANMKAEHAGRTDFIERMDDLWVKERRQKIIAHLAALVILVLMILFGVIGFIMHWPIWMIVIEGLLIYLLIAASLLFRYF